VSKQNSARNERNTENLVRNELRNLDYYDAANSVHVEEQKSVIEEVKRLLKNGSKSSKGGRGCPQFLVGNTDAPDFLIVFERKALISDHESSKLEMILAGKELCETEEEASKRIQR